MAIQNNKGTLSLTGISSNQILSLLFKKHSNDIIVPECKNGETWDAKDILKRDD